MHAFLVNLLASAVLLTLSSAVFVIPAILLRRATRQVIAIFRTRHALCSEQMKTVRELGLEAPTFFERIGKLKDYKPYAIDGLIRSDVVLVAPDGKVCLKDDKLGGGVLGSINDSNIKAGG